MDSATARSSRLVRRTGSRVDDIYHAARLIRVRQTNTLRWLVDFEPQLRSYLDSLSGAPAPRVPLRHIDAAAMYSHLLERLRQLESEQARGWIEQTHRAWSFERVERLARYLETIPLSPAQLGLETPEFAILDQAIGHEDMFLAIVDRLELRRILRVFEPGDLQRYALENRLVATGPTPGERATGLGRAFLRLRGRDAIQWLLTVEVVQSTGRGDRWRTPRALLEQALRGIEVVLADTGPHSPYAQETFDRLEELAVLSVEVTNAGVTARHYAVPDNMIRLVHAVLEPGPWHGAVTALLEDERAFVLQGREGSVAVQATAELTKLITHEVRNALVPVRHHLDALKTDVASGTLGDRIDKARRGVVRILEFVDEMVATRELIGEPATSCDIAEVIREALGRTDGGERVEVVAAGWHRVRAPRSRLVSAVHNVLLNALEATPAGGRIRASYRGNQDMVEIAIDDAGKGVPVELRSTIFDDGYTTRGGPGHGFGLALVRSVVETELRGKVWCEDSEFGGARFVLAIAAEPRP
jgi:signal transduction histidine kinase